MESQLPSECLSADEVVALAGGDATEDDATRMRRHIERCDACRSAVAGVARLRPTERSAKPSTQRSRAQALGPGDIFDERYRVERVVGRGGMGTVYAAWDDKLQRRLALKLIRASDPALTTLLSQRLVRESRAMARLRHPNVVTVYDAGEAGGQAYVAMELIEGGTLRAWQRAEPRPWRDVLAHYTAAGEGLAAAHGVGLVHRDFKPENVLLDKDGRALVTDFGLARSVLAPDLPSSGSDRSEGRGTGVAMGTPGYIAPEQYRGEKVDARADIFSFCVALYEALFGTRPFHGEDRAAIQDAIVAGEIAEPTRGGIPRRVRDAVTSGLRPDPADRPAALPDLLARLQPPRRRTGLIMAAIAVGALASSTALVPRNDAPVAASAKGFESIVPYTLIFASHARRDAGDIKGARATFLEATRSATAAGNDAALALAWHDLAGLELDTTRDDARAAEYAQNMASVLDTLDAGPQREYLEMLLHTLRGHVLWEAGQWARAHEAAELAVELSRARGGPELAQLVLLSATYTGVGRLAESVALDREIVARYQADPDASPPNLATAHLNLATALFEVGAYEEALVQARAGENVIADNFGLEHPEAAIHIFFVSEVLRSMGRFDEALARIDRAEKVVNATTPGEAGWAGILDVGRGVAMLRAGRVEQALPVFERAKTVADRANPDSTDADFARMGLGHALALVGRFAEADAMLREASQRLAQKEGPGRTNTLLARGVHGDVLVRAGRPDEAFGLLEGTITQLGAIGFDPHEVAFFEFALARALRATEGDTARMTQMARRAHTAWANAPGWRVYHDELTTWATTHAIELSS